MEQTPMEHGNVHGLAVSDERNMPGQGTMPGRYRVVNKRHYRAMILEEQVQGPYGVYTMRNQGIPVTLHPGSVIDDLTFSELEAFPDRFVATNEALVLTDEHGQPRKQPAEIAAEREAVMQAHAAVSAKEAKAKAAADEAYKKVMAEEAATPPFTPSDPQAQTQQTTRGTGSRSER